MQYFFHCLQNRTPRREHARCDADKREQYILRCSGYERAATPAEQYAE
jgi:hypothetical protein